MILTQYSLPSYFAEIRFFFILIFNIRLQYLHSSFCDIKTFHTLFLQGLNAGLEDIFVLYQALRDNDNDVKKGIYDFYRRLTYSLEKKIVFL